MSFFGVVQAVKWIDEEEDEIPSSHEKNLMDSNARVSNHRSIMIRQNMKNDLCRRL